MKKRTIIVNIILSVLAVLSFSALVYAATTISQYGYRSGKKYVQYSAKHDYDNPGTWGITINDIEIVDASSSSKAAWYSNELSDIGERSTYAVFLGEKVTHGTTKLENALVWLPDSTIPTKCRLNYMKLFKIPLKSKTGGLTITFGSDNSNSAVCFYELDANGVVLFDGTWTKTTGSYKITNDKTRYVMAYFKIEDGVYVDGSTTNQEIKLTDVWSRSSGTKTYLVFHPYEITLNDNGGRGGSGKVYERYQAAVYLDYAGTKKMTSSANKVKIPTRTGYTFKGYYNGSTQYINANGYVTSKFTKDAFKENTTLTAKWEPKTVKVTFHRNKNSSDTTTATQTFTYAVSGQSFSDKGWTYTGRTLSGWALESTATTRRYTVLSGVSDSWINTNSPSIDLYAVWTPNTYTVTFKPGCTSYTGSTADVKVTYGVSTALTANGFARTGYTFAGWHSSRASDGKSYYTNGTSSAWYSPGSEPDGYVLYTYKNGQKVSATSPVNGDTVTMTAVWATNAYTVTYDANGGSGSMASSMAVYGSSFTPSINAFTRTNYSFAGWNEKADGTGNSWSGTKTYGYTKDITLYAQWTPKTYAIKIDWSAAQTAGITYIYEKYASSIYLSSGSSNAIMTTTSNPIPLGTPNTYTVTLDANGGSCQNAGVSATDTFLGVYTASGGGIQLISQTGFLPENFTTTRFTANATIYARYGHNAVTLPAATRTGYTFVEWNTEPDGSGTGYAAGSSYTPVESHTLYAQWKTNTDTKYVVNHYLMNLDGSTYDLTETQSLSGTTESLLTINDLKKTYTGFTYKGGKGATSASASVPSSFDKTTTVLADGTRVINLYYTRNQYSVILDKGTGISSVSGAGTYYYGASVTVDATVSTGYTWSKWSGTYTLATKEYTFTMPSSDVTETATATINRYIVKFLDWDGSPISQKEYDHGESIEIPSNPTRADDDEGNRYTFLKWTPDVKTTCTDDATYTAEYTYVSYTYKVVFDANGGKLGSMEPQTFIIGKAAALNNNRYYREGFDFIGWAYSPGSKVPVYTDGQTVKDLCMVSGGSVTLYAVWDSWNKSTVSIHTIRTDATDYSFVSTDEEIDAWPHYSAVQKEIFKWKRDEPVDYDKAVFTAVYTKDTLDKFWEDYDSLSYEQLLKNFLVPGKYFYSWNQWKAMKGE